MGEKVDKELDSEEEGEKVDKEVGKRKVRFYLVTSLAKLGGEFQQTRSEKVQVR